MRRRQFITLLGGAAVWPLTAQAQQDGPVRRIGVLMAHSEADPEFQNYLNAFRQALRKLGWIEGRNVRIETRWGALDDAEARQQSAKELLALTPDLILTQNTPPTASMLQQTRNIPIVFVIVADPVGSGFVESLPHPGGNATGFTIMEATVVGKWVELLKEIAPAVSRAAFLFNPATSPYADIYLNPFKAARRVLRIGRERCARSRRKRARICRCRSCTRTERWADRDAGWLLECPSCGDRLPGRPLPPAYGISVAFLR
jgi:putative ABC transport system substrate-binding protein